MKIEHSFKHSKPNECNPPDQTTQKLRKLKMEKTQITIGLLMLALFFMTPSLRAQGINKGEVCFFIGKISLPAVTAGSFATCASSANPAACEIALWTMSCSADPLCSKTFEMTTKAGCQVTITLLGEAWEITAKASKRAEEDMKQLYKEAATIFNELDKVENMQWLQRYLSFH